jgi:hypothetical protein
MASAATNFDLQFLSGRKTLHVGHNMPSLAKFRSAHVHKLVGKWRAILVSKDSFDFSHTGC